jgi:release factor glutamine methyltransferase
MPKIVEILKELKTRLSEKNIDEYQIESEIIINHVLDINTEKLYSNLFQECTSKDYENIQKILKKRELRIPLPYIIQKCHFFGRTFHINSGVLIPRPETELLIERSIEYISNNLNKELSIIDIGTGSGIIGITLKLIFPDLEVHSIDISKKAIKLTKKNMKLHSLEGQMNLINRDFRKISLKKYDLILANLPYIPIERFPHLPPELGFEPKLALDGGERGIELIRDLIKLLPKIVNNNTSKAIIEIDETQLKSLKSVINLFIKSATTNSFKDLSKKNRLIEITNIK